MRLWDPRTGQCTHYFSDHFGPIFSLAFNEAGRFLASGSQDGFLHLYDMKAHLFQLPFFLILTVHTTDEDEGLVVAGRDHPPWRCIRYPFSDVPGARTPDCWACIRKARCGEPQTSAFLECMTVLQGVGYTNLIYTHVTDKYIQKGL